MKMHPKKHEFFSWRVFFRSYYHGETEAFHGQRCQDKHPFQVSTPRTCNSNQMAQPCAGAQACLYCQKAATEVNCRNGLHKLYGHKNYSQWKFRRLLSNALIYNSYLKRERDSPTRRSSPREKKTYHALVPVPSFHTYQDGVLTPSISPYPQKKCSCGAHRVRTHCQCTPGIYRCADCYAVHVSEGRLVPSTPDWITPTKIPKFSLGVITIKT